MKWSPGSLAGAVTAESVAQEPEATTADLPLRSRKEKFKELQISIIPQVCPLCQKLYKHKHISFNSHTDV